MKVYELLTEDSIPQLLAQVGQVITDPEKFSQGASYLAYAILAASLRLGVNIHEFLFNMLSSDERYHKKKFQQVLQLVSGYMEHLTPQERIALNKELMKIKTAIENKEWHKIASYVTNVRGVINNAKFLKRNRD